MTNPTLNSSTPSDNASTVALDTNIVLNFSEAVYVKTGNITIKKTYNNSVIETINVAGAQVTGTGTTQITINPSSNLPESTEIYITIDSTAFENSANENYAGITDKTVLSFNTIAVTPTVNYSTLQHGTISLSSIQSAFTFYNNSGGPNEWNIVGFSKGSSQFINTGNLNTNNLTVFDFIKNLAQITFGSTQADDFISNRSSILSSWTTAITNNLTSLNSTTSDGDASKELVDDLIYNKSARFYLHYNASVSGATSGTYTSLTATGSNSGATCTVTSVIESASIVQSIAVTTTNGTFSQGENVVIANGGGSGVNITITNINPVQVALLNGTINSSSVPTKAPLEVGDKIKILYQLSTATGQINASGNSVSFTQSFLTEYTVT